MKSDKFWLDMCAGSELKDSTGETLSIDGADIQSLENGSGFLNDNHGIGFHNHLGRITEAKKIKSLSDCKNDRQRYYWNKIKAPYIYCKGYIYNDADHSNAKAAIAILRNLHREKCSLNVKASVEGGVIERDILDPQKLARTRIKGVALTFTPANQATLVEPLNLTKSDYETDMILIKSVEHLAKTDVPSFRHIERYASAQKICENLSKIQSLVKEYNISIDIPDPIALSQQALENRIAENINKISSLVRQLKEEELNKSVKNVVAAAGLAAASALSNDPISEDKVKSEPMTHEKMVQYAANESPSFASIAMNESTGGKNIAHAKVNSGVNKGHTAAGPWGVMPHSVKSIMERDEKLRQDYPQLASLTSNIKSDHHKITDFLNKDPVAAYKVSKTLFDHLVRKFRGDVSKATYAWRNGVKATIDAVKSDPKSIKNDSYVKSMYHHKGKLTKALTAGYGGAGAPTGNVGGGVLQPQSLDKKGGLKYIVCSSCGKEQIYSKNQVSCKHCGKSFTFSVLHKFLSQ